MSLPLVPRPLVAGRARVPGQHAGELPHNPVRAFEKTVRSGIHARRVVRDLQRLRQQPFRRDTSAVSRQPRFVALGRDRGDPVGLPLRAMVLPQFGPRVPLGLERVELAQRSPVGGRRQHGARGEVDPNPDNVGGIDPCPRQGRCDAPLQAVQPVGRILQCPVGRQPLTSPWQFLVDDAVGVGFHRGGDGLTRRDIDEQCPDGLRSRSRGRWSTRTWSGPAQRRTRHWMSSTPQSCSSSATQCPYTPWM